MEIGLPGLLVVLVIALALLATLGGLIVVLVVLLLRRRDRLDSEATTAEAPRENAPEDPA